MIDLAFFPVLALFIAHELDAVRAHEWRLLPILRGMPDEAAYPAFVLMHVPLFVLFFWLMAHPSMNVRLLFQAGLDVFAIVHLGLHWLLRHHVLYEFNNRLSWGLIVGTALAGALHLGLLLTMPGYRMF